MTMNPISVHRFVGDVRIKLTVPASSPSGSSGDGGFVLSIIAKANDSGLAKDRIWVVELLQNRDLSSVAEAGGSMGKCVYISG